MAGIASIKLVKYKDTAMKEAIWYWVLIMNPNERVGPPYFLTKDEAITWADANGYKYK